MERKRYPIAITRVIQTQPILLLDALHWGVEQNKKQVLDENQKPESKTKNARLDQQRRTIRPTRTRTIYECPALELEL